ncbi:MAG: tetratricopeptide repeat protein [Dokdonella sp.]|uniref:serine/threonine-protein kinase n=1 Tax=Dokdonella sp. TaxID=2291710 RepID=UPI0025C21793|nr:serine/threonine-protein kinase [Dokdonella sp.]MBZ0222186.1 tetratricopeptide repeat protein [Dokdonella sp.]
MNTGAGPLERRWRELAPLFDRAFELEADARAAFIDAIEDRELREALCNLLTDRQGESPLDGDSGRFAAELIGFGLEGRRIGAWRVGRAIGAGGSATVFSARRDDGAYEQKVAIKILRHGILDVYERERFVRERTILARLEHPHIAHLFDGGLTAEGVPWFALELVGGAPVTHWCDARKLDLDARLRLFATICETVAYAQRNLVVHRDLKPSNILVDGEGQLKLLDFGIARLLVDGGSEDATRTEARRLTPAYAAPEQRDGGSVTTATDVYSLGVLLHELCTGQRPQFLADGSLRSAALALDAGAAQARSAELRSLRRRLDGELGLIIAKALAIDPQQRYASAAALHDELQRLAAGNPVLAKPDSRAYRFAKFVRRHRLAFAAGSALLIVILGATAATAWQARVARIEAARADAVRDFVLALFAGITPDESKGRVVSARELVDRGAARLDETLAGEPAIEAQLATTLATAYRQLGDYPKAMQFAQRALAAAHQPAARALAVFERGRIRAAQGDFDAAEQDLREALSLAPDASRGEVRLRLADVLAERGHLDEALSMANTNLAHATTPEQRDQALAMLGGIDFRRGKLADAARELNEALTLARANRGEAHTQTASIEHDLGVVVLQQGDAKAAVALFEQALKTRRGLLGDKHPDIADSLFNLGTALRRLGENDRAGQFFNEALAMQRELLGPKHPAVANSLNSLAVLAWQQGDPDTAIAYLKEALDVATAAHGKSHPSVIAMRNNLAGMLRVSGKLDEAETQARSALADARATLGENHYLTGVAQLGLGSILAERGQSAAALDEVRQAHAVLAKALGSDHADTLMAQVALADLERETGDLKAAAEDARQVLDAASKTLPAGHPRLGKAELVFARVAAQGGDCAHAVPVFTSAAQALAKGGVAMRSELAAAQLGLAQCLRASDPAQADEQFAQARATIASLPFVPRALARAAARPH